MAKKKKAKSKRRKGFKRATAAQLRALRKARAAAAKKRRGKKAARQSSRPKAKKHKRPIHHKSPKRKAGTMAKKKGHRKGSGRRRGRGGKTDIMHLATKIGIGAAGAVGGALIARQIPVDAKIKPFIPIAAGIAATMFIRNPLAGYAGVGMAIAGVLAAIKSFAPNVPMLAGFDDEELIYANGAAPQLMYDAPRVLNGVPVEYANGVPVEYANGDQDLVDVLQGY